MNVRSSRTNVLGLESSRTSISQHHESPGRRNCGGFNTSVGTPMLTKRKNVKVVMPNASDLPQ